MVILSSLNAGIQVVPREPSSQHKTLIDSRSNSKIMIVEVVVMEEMIVLPIDSKRIIEMPAK